MGEAGQTSSDHELIGVQGLPLNLLGAQVEVGFTWLEKRFRVDVQVAEAITTEIILGRDFLQMNKCSVEMGASNKLRFATEKVVVPFGVGATKESTIHVEIVMNKSLQLPPQSEMEIMLPVPGIATVTASVWLVESVSGRRVVDVARALVSPERGEVPVRILNTRTEPVELQKGKVIATMEPLAQEQLLETVSSVEKKPEVSEKIKANYGR